MNEVLSEIKKEIKKIEQLLEDPSHTRNRMDNEVLLKEFDRLNYDYFKAFMRQMRDMSGDGDGI